MATAIRPRIGVGGLAMLAGIFAAHSGKAAPTSKKVERLEDIASRFWGKLNDQRYCARHLNKKRGSMNRGIR